MGASHSKNLSTKQQQRKSLKSTKKSKSIAPKTTTILKNVEPSVPPQIEKRPSLINLDGPVGIDLYTSGATPSILIRDHNGTQPLSSLFPNDIPLSETLGSSLTSTVSTVSTLSDLFSTASIETPNSTLSSTSSKRFDSRHGGPSFVTHLNDPVSTPQVHVAQSKLIQGDNGFNDLLQLAHQHCVDAYYPLAECYFLGYHQPSRRPDKTNAYKWFVMAASSSSHLPGATIAWAYYRLALLLAQGEGCTMDMELALQYLERSADADNRYAQYMLGLHYQHGLLVQKSSPPDRRRALHWYERAARNGCVEAQVALGQLIIDHLGVWVEQSGHTQSKWIQLAIHWLELAAKQKNIKAHVTLGGLYDEGQTIARDSVKALHHYKAATELDPTNNSPHVILAHYFVGIHYRLSTPSNPSKACTHLELASKGNYAPAQRALGLLYMETGPLRDSTLAHHYLTLAAAQGDIQALGMLGQQAERQHTETAISMYKKAATAGSVAAQLSLANLLLRTDRRADAFPWFQLAATNPACLDIGHLHQRNLARLMVARYTYNGWHDTDKIDRGWAYREFLHLADHEQLVEAQFWVGACYEQGILDSGQVIVACDPIKAFDYYLKSAVGGDLDGQFQVALMLANGSSPGIEKDTLQAFKWYTTAAERGHPTAQYTLGLFYERGLAGVGIDLAQARLWYERASLQQHTTAMIALAQLLLHHHAGSSKEEEMNHQDALHWLHTAATNDKDKNYTAALRALAGVFEQGKIAVARADPDRYHKGWLLLQKAEMDPLAWVDRARYHEYGLGMNKSCEEALACLEQAQLLGYQKAQMEIGDLYYRHKMWTNALGSYEKVVEANALLKKPGWNARLAIARLDLIEGYDSSQPIYDWLVTMVAQPATDDLLMEPLELLGICYEHGKETTKNLESAIDCYKRVTKITSAHGMNWIQERTRFRLVEIYMQNDDHSLAWEQLQVTKTHFSVMNHQCKSSRTLARTARFYIGYLLLHWYELNSRSNEAQEWLAQASDEGDGNAALELAKLHESKHEFDLAKQRLEQGVSASHSGCMVALALTMEDNSSDQLELLERAIELNHTPALYHYGRLVYESYLDDPTHPQSLLDSALDYYTKAAAQGDQRSMRRIGQLYDSLHQYTDAQVWFEQSPTDLFSHAMLLKYQLGDAKETTIQELRVTADTLYQRSDTMDRMDRMTLSQVYFSLGTEPDLLRAHSLHPTAETTYTLGIHSESHHGDLDRAMDYFRTSAERWNHAESQYKLGLYHANGHGGVEPNLVAAQRYLKLAAAQGHEPASSALGTVMVTHAWELWHTQHQHARALAQYEHAAALHIPDALVALGHLYHTGSPPLVPQSYKQAFTYYIQAARQNHPQAALMLGSYYEEGTLDTTPHWDEALMWYENAYRWKAGALAELAIGKLKHRLAETCTTRRREELQEEAYTWFEGAACDEAKVMVALYHLNGWGGQQCDPPRGFQMLQQLVSRVDTALVEIATCYERGWGVPKDLSQALVYYEKAAEIGELVALRRAEEWYRSGLTGVCDLQKADAYGRRADLIEERATLDERGKSVCSTCSSSSSSYASRRSSLNSLNQLY